MTFTLSIFFLIVKVKPCCLKNKLNFSTHTVTTIFHPLLFLPRENLLKSRKYSKNILEGLFLYKIFNYKILYMNSILEHFVILNRSYLARLVCIVKLTNVKEYSY